MDKKYYRFVMTFFICAPFSALMSLIGIIRSVGLSPETASRWFTTWLAMLPAAYIAALIIVPVAVAVGARHSVTIPATEAQFFCRMLRPYTQ